MKKPEPLVSLLEELQTEAGTSEVVAVPTSKVIIYTDPEAADEEDGISLTGEQAKLLFASVETVERLFDALNDPDDASICFFDLTLPAHVMDTVERKCIAVDEG